MTNLSYYNGKRSFMTADLKATAHRVRQAIDARKVTTDPDTGREVNPRRARLVHRASLEHDRAPGLPPVLEAPHLSPRARHALAWEIRGRR